MVVELDDLDEPLVRRRARHDQPGGLEPLAQEDVDLVAVAVALVDDGLAVELARPRAGVELDRIGAQAHRAAEVGDLLLLGQEVDDGVRRLGIELRRVRAVHVGDVAGELAHRDLHAQADAEVRDPRSRATRAARILPSIPRPPKPPGTRMPSAPARRRRASLVVERLGVHPVDLDLGAVLEARVAQRLDDRHVGVLELDVLADERDAHGRRRARPARSTVAPSRRARRPAASIPKWSQMKSSMSSSRY